MTAATSHSEVPIPLEENSTSKDQRIRGQARTLTNLMVGMEKLNLRQLMIDDAGSYQLYMALIMIANDTKEDGERFPENLFLTNSKVIEKGGATTARTLQRRRAKLSSYKVNGESLVNITVGPNLGPNSSCDYSINYDLFLNVYNPIQIVPNPVKNVGEPGQKCRGSEFFPPDPPIRFKEGKKEEEPKPTLMVVSTGNGKDHTKVSGSGYFQFLKAEDSQIVRDMILYGVNRTIIEKAMRKKGEVWVRRIYQEFNKHVGKENNINFPPAVLASRLKDYDETWRKVFDKPPDSRELLTEMSPAMVEKWQADIDKHLAHPKSNPKFIPQIIRDAARDSGVSFTVAMDALDSRGIEVAL